MYSSTLNYLDSIPQELRRRERLTVETTKMKKKGHKETVEGTNT